MNQEQKRIRIAESRGWTDVRRTRMFGCGLVLRGFEHFKNAGVPVSTRENIPDYFGDLNACHELENTLTEEQFDMFQKGLANLVDGAPFELYRHWSDVGGFRTVSAEAALRAEAYGKTLGLW